MRHQLLPVALVLFTLPLRADGGTVTLEPDRDNTMFDHAVNVLASGSGDFVVAGNTGQSLGRRALLRFDLAAALPAGAQVVSAALTLTLRQTSAGPHTVTVHAVSTDWGEGASVALGGSGAPAAAGDATWQHTFYPGSFWATPGGDFAPSPSAAAVVDQVGAYTWSSPALAGEVQAMLDQPALNFGWVLVGDESKPQTTKLFGSRESITASERPALTVSYVLPVATYCTAGTSSSGCQASLSASGTASASAASGFVLNAAGVEGGREGLFFFGTSGRQLRPWGNTASFRCVLPPVQRTPPQPGVGAPGTCQGTFALDLNGFWSARPAANPGAGAVVQAQLFYFDGPLGALSDAVEFAVCP